MRLVNAQHVFLTCGYGAFSFIWGNNSVVFGFFRFGHQTQNIEEFLKIQR